LSAPEDGLAGLDFDVLTAGFAAPGSGFTDPVFEVEEEDFETGFEVAPDGLDLPAGVVLVFEGAAGLAEGFDDAAPEEDLVLEAGVLAGDLSDGVGVLLEDREVVLPDGAVVFRDDPGLVLPDGAEVAFAWLEEAAGALAPSVAGLAAGRADEGSSEISPRISFSRSEREIDRPFNSLTEISSAGAALPRGAGCDDLTAGAPAGDLVAGVRLARLVAGLAGCVSGAGFGVVLRAEARRFGAAGNASLSEGATSGS
jgi:hypothetical protein